MILLKTDVKGETHSYNLLTYLQSVADEINVSFSSYYAGIDKSGLIPQLRISGKEE